MGFKPRVNRGARKHKLTLMEGIKGTGLCLFLNDRRIAGGNPWLGGKVLREWEVTEAELDTAMATWKGSDG